jgi:hypothetical protein
MARMNDSLRAEGLIVAWRDEPFPLFSVRGEPVGVSIERAATRFWGSLTLGAHCNGYVADAAGRPEHLWIARRSSTKATDPGRLDNLVGESQEMLAVFKAIRQVAGALVDALPYLVDYPYGCTEQTMSRFLPAPGRRLRGTGSMLPGDSRRSWIS